MRLSLGVIIVSAVGSLVACGGTNHELMPHGDAVTGPGGGGSPAAGAAANPAPTAAQSACAGLGAPATLSTAKDVRNIQIVGSAVFFQSGTTLFRVGKDGKGQVAVFSSPSLVRTYVDQNAILAIESTDDATTATLRVIAAVTPADATHPFPDFGQPTPDPAPDPNAVPPGGDVKDANIAGADATGRALPVVSLDGTAVATNFVAAGIDVFASDDAFFYFLADDQDGDTLVQMAKQAPAPQAVVTVANVLSHPQLLGTDIWYVQDQQHIFKVTIDVGNPAEVFGIDQASCDLAVSATSAFCSVGSAVERRDLTGGNRTILLDTKSSKTAASFGALLARDSTLYIPSVGSDPNVKNLIVALSTTTPGDQKLVACGRGAVSQLNVDGSSVAWTEGGNGVFLAPR